MLFNHVRQDAELSQEETFGLVAGLFGFKDQGDAPAVLHDTRFGPAAGVGTMSLAKAEAFKPGARAGILVFNLPAGGTGEHAPSGGVGWSGGGLREQGRAARACRTQSKTMYQQATSS